MSKYYAIKNLTQNVLAEAGLRNSLYQSGKFGMNLYVTMENAVEGMKQLDRELGYKDELKIVSVVVDIGE